MVRNIRNHTKPITAAGAVFTYERHGAGRLRPISIKSVCGKHLYISENPALDVEIMAGVSLDLLQTI